MRRILLATALVLLAVTATETAHAGLYRLDVVSRRPPAQPANTGGPVFAGDDVVWAEHAVGLEYRVRGQDPSGATRDLGTLPNIASERSGFDSRNVYLAASPARLLASAFDVAYGDRYADYSRGTVWTGPPQGPLAQLRTQESAESSPVPTGILATEGAFAIGGEVFAEDAPSTPVASYQGLADLAGDLALWRGGGQLRVIRWRDGAELYRLESDALVDARLQADGKVAMVLRGDDFLTVAWASPEEPRPHVLPIEQRHDLTVDIANDRVLVTTLDNIALLDLDGRVVSLVDAPDLISGPAFDGRRLAWLARRCSATFLATWAPGEPVPRLPEFGCRPPAPSPFVFRLDRRRGTITVVLNCPADAANGCDGEADVVVQRDGRRRGPFRRAARFESALLPGQSSTTKLTLRPRARRMVRTFRDVRFRVRVYDFTLGAGLWTQRTYRMPPRP